MRILVMSDIHENIGNVRLLRAQEKNNYDAVIVGGDIGDEIAGDFYSIIDSFRCPAYVVYGNWDTEQEYTERLSERCALLHHRLAPIGPYVLSGFSGSPTSRGRNPMYQEEMRQTNTRHQKVIATERALYVNIAKDQLAVEKDFEERLFDLTSHAKDRRRSSYINKVSKLEEMKRRAMERAKSPWSQFCESQAYRAYQTDADKAHGRVLKLNRAKLFDLVRSEAVSREKLILLTHERLYRIAEEGVTPLLHIFGHRHEHSFNYFKGTHYLNAAAIDHGLSENLSKETNLQLGYCAVELNGSAVTVHRRLIPRQKRQKGGRWIDRYIPRQLLKPTRPSGVPCGD